MRLELGGVSPGAGWLAFDPFGGRSPQAVGKLGILPFKDCTAERIHVGHALSLVPRTQLAPAARELRRVLCRDGLLVVADPDSEIRGALRRASFGTVFDAPPEALRDDGWPLNGALAALVAMR